MSKIETSTNVKFEEVDIKPAIEQTLRNYKLNADEKKVEIVQELEDNMQLILGNWDLILQVIDNLVGNALKFNKSNGKIVLRAYTWPDICIASSIKETNNAPACDIISPLPRIRVEVGDTGCGISEEGQARIFERFYRVENLSLIHI